MEESTIDYINQVNPDMKEAVKQLHDILMEIEPSYYTDEAWGGLAFYRDEEVSCVIQVFPDHMKLIIRDGHAIYDENDILEGEGDETYIRMDNGMDILSSEIEDILTKQFALHDHNNDDIYDDEDDV